MYKKCGLQCGGVQEVEHLQKKPHKKMISRGCSMLMNGPILPLRTGSSLREMNYFLKKLVVKTEHV